MLFRALIKQGIRASVAILLLGTVAACGFTPMYGNMAGPTSAGQVEITEIKSPGRTGHELRQELVRELNNGIPGVAGKVRLDVTLGVASSAAGFTVQGTASRSDYSGTAAWKLVTADGNTLYTGAVTERASYNTSGVTYSDMMAQVAAQQRLAALLASALRDDIVLAASRKDNKPK